MPKKTPDQLSIEAMAATGQAFLQADEAIRALQEVKAESTIASISINKALEAIEADRRVREDEITMRIGSMVVFYMSLFDFITDRLHEGQTPADIANLLRSSDNGKREYPDGLIWIQRIGKYFLPYILNKLENIPVNIPSDGSGYIAMRRIFIEGLEPPDPPW